MARTKEPPVLVVEPPKDDEDAPRSKNCGNCHCSYFDPRTGQGTCHHEPAKHFLYLVPQQNAITGKPDLVPAQWSAWPVIRRDQFCVTGWRPKETH